MDKKAVLAVLISFGIWIGWQKLYLEPYQQSVAAAQKQMAAAQPKTEAASDQKTELNNEPGKSSGTITAKGTKSAAIDAESFSLTTTNGTSFLGGWSLKRYFKTLVSEEGVVSLKDVTGFSNQLELRINDDRFSDLLSKEWSAPEGNRTSLRSTLDANRVKVLRKIETNGGYYADLTYTLSFKVEPPKYVFLDLIGSPKREHDKEGSIFGEAPDKVHVTYRDGNTRHSVMADALKEPVEAFAGVRWLGIDTRYFVLALVPEPELRKNSGIQIFADSVDGLPAVKGSLVVPTGGKKELSFTSRVYFGPKHIDDLEKADPVLRDSIDFGWTSALAIPLLKALKFLYSLFGNYGLAIIVLTFGIKILLYPLTYKSMKSMAKMSQLQPQLTALREKFKDDKEKLNQEMMNFMKTNGYNPMGGCLPILLQMPIFFSLYRVLFNSIELYQAPFLFWIKDLSSPDAFFVTPVLLAGLMYLQQKLSPSTATDPTQQKMLQFMPLIFGFFMIMLPAGLNIYMVVNSLVSIGQQWFLNRKFGIVPGGKKVVPAKA